MLMEMLALMVALCSFFAGGAYKKHFLLDLYALCYVVRTKKLMISCSGAYKCADLRGFLCPLHAMHRLLECLSRYRGI